MKLISSLKFLVVLMVILAVFSKRVSRSTTLNKVSTRLDAMAESKASCFDGKWGSDYWVYIDTNSIQNGNSGFIIKNYYKSESFNCKYMNRISDQDSKKRYFASFRDFSPYSGPISKEESWYLMRRLLIIMKNGIRYNFFIDKQFFGSDAINKEELKTVISKMQNRVNNYLTTFRTYKNKMATLKVNAEELTSLKKKNLNTKQALQAEVANKKAEITITQETLKDLNAKAEASKLQIRNYEKEINTKKNGSLREKTDNLKVYVQSLEALTAQIMDNENKIKGIVPIDKNDLTASITNLKAKLTALRETYLYSDPKYMQFSSLILNLDQVMDTIPQVIA